MLEMQFSIDKRKESPKYVKTSFAAAIALKFYPGRFYRDAKPYCVNLLQTYSRDAKPHVFIAVFHLIEKQLVLHPSFT